MWLTFLEGLASFVSPCTLPLLPVYAAYFAADEGNVRLTAVRSLAFVAGFTLVFVTLGVFAGTLGTLLAAHRQVVRLVCGTAIVAIGLGYLGLFRLPGISFRRRIEVRGIGTALLFGFVFALGLTPCVGAFLASALLEAAAAGTAASGALKLIAYSLGLGLPFFLSALFINQLKGSLAMIKSHYRLVNILSGGLLVVAGAAMAATAVTPAVKSREAIDSTAAKPVPAAPVAVEGKPVAVSSATFAAEVLETKGPVLVDFWAPWCGPCRRLGPVLEEIAKEQSGKVKVCKVNVDECGDLARKYNITGIPAVFVFRDGKIAASSVGLRPKADILKLIETKGNN